MNTMNIKQMKRTAMGIGSAICLTMLTYFNGATAEEEWIPHQVPSLEGGTSTAYFSNQFSKRLGTFAASYDSLFDPRKTVSGEFLVGKYRYVHESPIGTQYPEYPMHDELTTEVILECKDVMAEAISQTYKLNGKIVLRSVTEDESEILMTQVRGPSTIRELCRFAQSVIQDK